MVLYGMPGMIGGMNLVSVREVRVMRGLLMIAGFVLSGCFFVVARSVFVMLGCLIVMMSCFV